jgi:hypothetical protein
MTASAARAPDAPAADWHAANQRYLAAATAVVRGWVDATAAGADDATAAADRQAAAHRELEAAGRAMPGPAALEVLAAAFQLSPFERDVVVLCAAVELDAAFAGACARAHGDARRGYPTFSLALAALPAAHWSALAPGSPLRRLQLIHPGAPGSGDALTASPLRIDERVLHFLAGVNQIDDRLVGLVDRVPVPAWLPPSHARIAEGIVALWTRAAASPDAMLPVIQLFGPDDDSQRRIAAAAAASVAAALYGVPATALGGIDEALVARLLTREAALGPAAVMIACEELDPGDPRASAAARLAERTAGLVVVTSRDRRRPGRRPMHAFEIAAPTQREQRALWSERIAATRLVTAEPASDRPMAAAIDRLVAQFDLGAGAIEAACDLAAGPAAAPREAAAALWDACRVESRPRLDDLAQRIDARAG